MISLRLVRVLRALCLPALSLLPVVAAAAADLPASAPPPDVDALAAAIRIRGFACDAPLRAAADPSDTHPDRQAWIVECAGRRYRLVYDGDTGSQVTPLN